MYATTSQPALWSLWAAATESSRSRACAPQQEKPPQWEAHALQLESNPYLLQLEKAQAQQQMFRMDQNKLIN